MTRDPESQWNRFAARHIGKMMAVAAILCGACTGAPDRLINVIGWCGCAVVGLMAADIDQRVSRLLGVSDVR